LGIWKNYEDLEESLSVDELIKTISAIHEKEARQNKFLAAIQGVELEPSAPDPGENDVTKLKGYQAAKAGFGIGEGLGYVVEE
jgi:hypothetical protein